MFCNYGRHTTLIWRFRRAGKKNITISNFILFFIIDDSDKISNIHVQRRIGVHIHVSNEFSITIFKIVFPLSS